MTGTAKDAAARLGALGATVFFDVSPLLEQHWTGIPVVAAGLARALRRVMPGVRFFVDTFVLDTDAVDDALGRNTGLFLERDVKTGHAVTGPIPVLTPPGAGPRVAIFPSVKRPRGAFDIETSVVHDVSTIVMPVFHIRGNVEYHTESLLADLASNAITFAVSQATRDDLGAYLGIDVLVAANGVGWPDWFEAAADNAVDRRRTERYYLILGTREPRKNIARVFDLLESRRDLLDTHRFVFAGRLGWLEEQHSLPRTLEDAAASGRIKFTGFVSEVEKYVLLRGAEATLYPSLFEGFGLPVLESLSAGTPCVASWSSSIPEVGGDVCTYFDPLSTEDFARALGELGALRRRHGARLAAMCRERARLFGWDDAIATILGALADESARFKARAARPRSKSRPRPRSARRAR